MENVYWYKFTEYNDNEGETWNFFIQLTFREWDYLSELIEEDDSYSLSDEELEESEVDILVKHTTSGYMDSFNKVGRPYLDIVSLTDTDNLYKARAWFGQ